MLALGPLVQVHDEEDPMRSDTTLLAAALITLGFPQASRDFFHTTCEFIGGAWHWRSTWTFHGETHEPTVKGLDASVVRDAWRDPSGMWLLRNPGSPVCVLREGLRYDRIGGFVPQFSRQQLAVLATPDTWLEAGYRNLVHILTHMPRAVEEARGVIRFAPRRAAFVPRCLSQTEQTRRIKFAEATDYAKRRSILRDLPSVAA